MCAWIRYFFPSINPHALDEDEFAIVWWEAEYLLRKVKPIQHERPQF